MDFDGWNEMLKDESIEAADAPEDWSGSVDVDSEDLGREFEDNVQPQWSSDRGRLSPR